MMKILSLDPRRITVFARRTCFALLVMATTALIAERMFGMLQINGLTPLKLAICFVRDFADTDCAEFLDFDHWVHCAMSRRRFARFGPDVD